MGAETSPQKIKMDKIRIPQKRERKTSQELCMLSSVTIICQVIKIVMNPGSQLSVLLSVSQMSQVPMISLLGCSLTEVHLSYRMKKTVKEN